MKTFIRWSGNKSKYLKHILPHIPSSFTTYIEPFLGSGALFLHLQPQKWIINDLNEDVVNVWRNIQTNNVQIIRCLQMFKNKVRLLYINMS